MIDPADQQTEALPLEPQKRGRGRPATGQAMTPAEKQRAYRQRLADQQKSQVPAVQLEKVRSTAAEYLEKLGQQLADAKAETAAAIARAEQAERNVTVNGDTFYNKETVVDLELKVISLRKASKESAQQLADAKAENEKLMTMLEAAQKEISYWTQRALQTEKGNVTENEKPGKPKKGNWVLQMRNAVPGARWKSITTGDGWETEESAKKSEENIRTKYPEDRGRYEYRVHSVRPKTPEPTKG